VPKQTAFATRLRALALFVAILSCTALAPPASAAVGAHLVKDIRFGAGSDPEGLTAVGDTLFFSAQGPGGRELWRSDGTEAGTVRVKNIRSGSEPSWPIELTNVDGTLFFSAFDGIGWGLWTSDGTEPGTVLVDRISVDSMVPYLGEAFFVVGDDVGDRLWRSDGTLDGTRPVKLIGEWPNRFITELEVAGNRLYIGVTGGDGETDELWVSDGTESGTKHVKTINNVTGGFSVHTLTGAGGRLFFLRDTEACADCGAPNPAVLWTSNGTAAGTRRVNGPQSAYNLIAARGSVMFQSGEQLWKSNGSSAGTRKLGNFSVSARNAMTKVGAIVYFAGDGLWKTDGTVAGTQQVADVMPHFTPPCSPHGPCSFVHRDYDPVGVRSKLYFPADSPGDGIELWSSDGTDAGTELVADVRLGTDSSRPASLVSVAGNLFFVANDGVHGRELWRFVP